MNNSCKIAAGRSPERFSEITVSPGRQKYRFITPFFLHFRAPTLLRGKMPEILQHPAKSCSREKHHRPIRDLKFYDIIMTKRLNRIIIPTTIYMQVPKNGNGGIAIGQSKA